jgi:hypothetical protein
MYRLACREETPSPHTRTATATATAQRTRRVFEKTMRCARYRDGVSGVEARVEGKQKAAARPRRHEHPIRAQASNRNPFFALVVRHDGPPQWQKPLWKGVTYRNKQKTPKRGGRPMYGAVLFSFRFAFEIHLPI